ncbi:hypothetical protein DH2020_020230 [Rehmannia glutinosa]|uniref:Sulfotransferase n=1 Tax=Rehmannia glutinosa TaxID=99300 RepID=A0ABR0WFI5_REHGL
MKTGTGWLKAISFSIIKNDVEEDILATETPYFLVPSVVTSFSATKPLPFDIYDASSPRLLHTHVAYSLLPDSIKNSACKIIYITRNPKDTIISMWHFLSSIKGPFPLEEVVNSLCCGVYPYGSFFDHVVEYWMESKKRPEKILFLKAMISKIAEFLGKPFLDEVQVEEIIKRCSLERLKNLDVNKNGSFKSNVPNSAFFRKGEVSDWKNYLTPEMVERINQITHIKLETLGIFL